MVKSQADVDHYLTTVCRSCRTEALRRQYFVEIPATGVPGPRGQGARGTHVVHARFVIRSQGVPFTESQGLPGCTCDGRQSSFFAPIFDDSTHSAMFWPHLRPSEMLMLAWFPLYRKVIRETCTRDLPSGPSFLAAFGAQQDVFRKRTAHGESANRS